MSRVWSGACGCGVAFALTSGCSPEVPSTFWRIALAGQTVGEERREDTPDGWNSHRRYTMQLGSDVVSFQASSHWSVVGTQLTTWQSGETTVAMSQPLPANLFARQNPGVGRVFDPNTQSVRVGQFEVDAERQIFADADVRWWVQFEDDKVVAYGADSVRVTREAGPIAEWQPIDPAVVLGLSGAGPLTSQGQVFARLDVQGPIRTLVDNEDGQVRLRRPLWQEIPNRPATHRVDTPIGLAAEIASKAGGVGPRDALGVLVDEVRDRLRYQPTPIADPRAALHGATGDCTEHVALFVEAAGLLGLQAKPVVGWVALPSGDWVPHAWAVVAVAGVGEVPVDPTLGERIASPLHLPLAARFQDRPWESLGKSVGSSVDVVELR